MNKGSTVFAQVLDFLPMHQFRRCVERYQGNYRVRSFTCFDQYLCMAFAQITYRKSLRDIECWLRAMDKSSTTLAFVVKSPVVHWQMPTRPVIGEYIAILLSC